MIFSAKKKLLGNQLSYNVKYDKNIVLPLLILIVANIKKPPPRNFSLNT
jgi:hypothetical protein